MSSHPKEHTFTGVIGLQSTKRDLQAWNLLLGGAYILWGFLFKDINPNHFDPLIMRIIIATPLVGWVLLSEKFPSVVKYGLPIFVNGIKIGSAWYAFLVFANIHSVYYAPAYITIFSQHIGMSPNRRALALNLLLYFTIGLMMVIVGKEVTQVYNFCIWCTCFITFGWGRLETLNAHHALLKEQELTLHSAKLASIGTLAAGVAHEIKNPVQIIIGITHTLKDVHEGASLQKQYDNILTACERVDTIVGALRSYARTDGDKMEPISLNTIVDQTMTLMRPLIKKSMIPVKVECSDELNDLLISGNAGKIQQVLINLLNNATDALEKRENPLIRIGTTLNRGTNTCSVSVTDNGSGMDAKVAAKIFDPFFTTKPPGKGTGLGLSIVHSIIKAHNAEIKCESVINIGTTFTITFPIQSQ